MSADCHLPPFLREGHRYRISPWVPHPHTKSENGLQPGASSDNEKVFTVQI